MIRCALTLSLLITPPAFAGGDDDPFEMDKKSIKLRVLDPVTRNLMKYQLDEKFTAKIIQRIEKQRDTIEEIDLAPYYGENMQNLFRILQALEKCPKIRFIMLGDITDSVALGLQFLKRVKGLNTYSRSTLNKAAVNRTLIVRLSHHLEYEPVLTGECYHDMILQKEEDNRVEAFIKKCRDENIHFLSDPQIHKIFESPYPWSTSKERKTL